MEAHVRPTATAPVPESTSVIRLISQVSGWLGSFPAILLSVLLIVVWGLTGPIFHFSDTWQLIINTSTTIITFNMVFVIQNTQNRDGRAMQAKLDQQSLALAKVLDTLGVGTDDQVLLDRLVGVEEAPERTIKDEQRKVHERSPSTPT